MTVVVIKEEERIQTTYTFYIKDSIGPHNAIDVVLDSFLQLKRLDPKEAFTNQQGSVYWSRMNKRDCTLDRRPTVPDDVIELARDNIIARLNIEK